MVVDDLSTLGPASDFMVAAGLHLEEVTADVVTGHIDLDARHHQPRGIVHGGVYAAAVETAASVGAAAAAVKQGLGVVGVSNHTNFLRPMVEGRVDVTARPIQQGRTQQLWQVDISDASTGKLVAVGQVRLQNIAPRA